MLLCGATYSCSHLLSPKTSLLQGLKKEMDIDVRVIGVTNSSQMLLSEQGLSLTDWEQQFERWAQTGQPCTPCFMYSAERAPQIVRCLAPAVFR